MKIKRALRKIIQNAFVISVFLMRIIDIEAQTSEVLSIKIEDGWIEKMNNRVSADISFNNSYNIFELKTPTSKILLYPNTPNNLLLKINYEFISFGIQFAPDFLPGNGDKSIKGNTKSFQLETTLIFKHWFADLSYSKVKGFYLENTSDFNSSWVNGDVYIQFPDLHYDGFSISSGYINNSKFSFRSLTSQTERQLKSAGSFIPVFNVDYYVIDDKSAGSNTQKSNNIEMSVGPGYAKTFVVKEQFYFSLGLFSSLGYLNTKLLTRTPEENMITNQDNFIFRWEGKTGIGYNNDKFYTGIYANVSGTKYKQEKTTAINFETRVFYHLFFGIRLIAPDYLERKMTKIKNRFQ